MLKTTKSFLVSEKLKNLYKRARNFRIYAILPAIALLVLFVYLIQIAVPVNLQNIGGQATKILVDNNKMKFSLKQGEVKQYPLRLTNTGQLHSYFSIIVEALKNFVVPNKKSFDIGPKKAEDISFIAYAPYNEAPDIYEGKFVIKEVKNVKESINLITNNVVREEINTNNIINVIYSLMDISTKNSLFDVALKPVRISKNIVAVGIVINNNGAPTPADVRFELYAKRIGSDIIDSRIKRISIDKSIEFGELMNVTQDKFIVYSKLRHNGEVLVSSAFFDESPTGKKPEQGSAFRVLSDKLIGNAPYLAAFIVAVMLAIILVQKRAVFKSQAPAIKQKPVEKPAEDKSLAKLKSRLMALEKTKRQKRIRRKQ